MKHDISRLNKAHLLVALYENAKTSKWTRATIENEICRDPYVFNMLREKYQPEVNAKFAKLVLTEDQAQKLLDSPSIDYIGPVLIKINFSGDKIDTSAYDEAHQKDNKEINVKYAREI